MKSMTIKIGAFALDNIYYGDNVQLSAKLPDQSIDLVVTSPPYDALRDYKGKPAIDLLQTGKQVFRILKDGGIAAVVIQDQTKDFCKSLTSFRMAIDWCDNVGFKLFECLIYKKLGAEGAWWNKRFRVDHEYMLVFLKGDRPQFFDKEPLKIPSKWGGVTMTGGGTRLTNGIRIDTRPITINPKKCRGTVWEYLTAGDGSRMKHQHPATFPDKLPYDFIRCFCPPDGIVLDPFMGSGTTALAALTLKRRFLGFDISEEYVELAKQRILSDRSSYQEKAESWNEHKTVALDLFSKHESDKPKTKKEYEKSNRRTR
jgi:site-specific DNA-methyltransferase (adenine-specific)